MSRAIQKEELSVARNSLRKSFGSPNDNSLVENTDFVCLGPFRKKNAYFISVSRFLKCNETYCGEGLRYARLMNVSITTGRISDVPYVDGVNRGSHLFHYTNGYIGIIKEGDKLPNLPGGKREDDETPLMTLIREIFEETSYCGSFGMRRGYDISKDVKQYFISSTSDGMNRASCFTLWGGDQLLGLMYVRITDVDRLVKEKKIHPMVGRCTNHFLAGMKTNVVQPIKIDLYGWLNDQHLSHMYIDYMRDVDLYKKDSSVKFWWNKPFNWYGSDDILTNDFILSHLAKMRYDQDIRTRADDGTSRDSKKSGLFIPLCGPRPIQYMLDAFLGCQVGCFTFTSEEMLRLICDVVCLTLIRISAGSTNMGLMVEFCKLYSKCRIIENIIFLTCASVKTPAMNLYLETVIITTDIVNDIVENEDFRTIYTSSYHHFHNQLNYVKIVAREVFKVLLSRYNMESSLLRFNNQCMQSIRFFFQGIFNDATKPNYSFTDSSDNWETLREAINGHLGTDDYSPSMSKFITGFRWYDAISQKYQRTEKGRVKPETSFIKMAIKDGFLTEFGRLVTINDLAPFYGDKSDDDSGETEECCLSSSMDLAINSGLYKPTSYPTYSWADITEDEINDAIRKPGKDGLVLKLKGILW